MFPDLKIAFCISGEPRQYKHCYKNLLDYIEDFKIKLMNNWGPNSKLAKEGKKLCIVSKHNENNKMIISESIADPKDFKVTVDIFIHSWSSVSTHRNYQIAGNKRAWDPKQHIKYDVDELRDDLIEKYNPKRILVESKDVMDDLHKYYVEKGLIREKKQLLAEARKYWDEHPDEARVTLKEVARYVKNGEGEWDEEPPYESVNDLKDSNYLALMQHISGQRAAYLKTGLDISCQSEDVIGDRVPNDYDIAVKTRTDVLYSAKRSYFTQIVEQILNFEKNERTPNGMTYFIHQNIRNGNLAVSLTQWWSNNKQFDMLHRNFVERLLSYKQMPIRHTCHHDMIGYHIQKIGISSREWNSRGKSTDFGLYVPGTPESFKNEQDGSARQTDIMRNFNREYQVTHHKRMKESEKSL